MPLDHRSAPRRIAVENLVDMGSVQGALLVGNVKDDFQFLFFIHWGGDVLFMIQPLGGKEHDKIT